MKSPLAYVLLLRLSIGAQLFALGFVAVHSVLTLAATPSMPSAAPPLSAQPEVATALQLLDGWIAENLVQRELPGLSIGIVYDQELIWAKGYGFADLERRIRTTPGTLYRLGSITKLFTATAIMQLRDAQKLRLDDAFIAHLKSRPGVWFATHEQVANYVKHGGGAARSDSLDVPP